MTLSDYLDLEGMKPSGFARRLGVPPSTITRVLSGRNEPGLPLMRRIVEATEGRVTPNDFAMIAPSRDGRSAA